MAIEAPLLFCAEISDVMLGDQSLFMRFDMVEEVRPRMLPVLESWAASEQGTANYPAGSEGSRLARHHQISDGYRAWRPIESTAECAG